MQLGAIWEGLPRFTVRFFRETTGAEPVRAWLKALPDQDKLDLAKQRLKKFRSAT
jgi:hypothetical protein